MARTTRLTLALDFKLDRDAARDAAAAAREAQDAPGFADLPMEVLARKLAVDMRLAGELVVTTAERIVPANTPTPPMADTG